MKKSSKKFATLLTVALGMTMMVGCGKKQMTADEFIDKYADKCTLGEYKGVEYELTKTDITEDMISEQVYSLLQQYATTNTITTGTVETGDTINISFVGTIDGVPFDGGSSDEGGYSVTVGQGKILFDDQLAGHKVGETFTAEITFPEDYGVEDLNGKDAAFEVTINNKSETVLPTYTDEFVASYTDASSIAEYEEDLKNQMVEYYGEYDSYYNKSAVTQNVINRSVILSYPEKELEELTNDTIASIETEAKQYGYSLDVYVTARYGFASEDDFREYIADVVSSYMQEKIVICAIAKAENITLSKDEISAYKEKMIENSNVSKEEFDAEYSYDDVLFAALEDKVATFLVDNGVGIEAADTENTAEE